MVDSQCGVFFLSGNYLISTVESASMGVNKEGLAEFVRRKLTRCGINSADSVRETTVQGECRGGGEMGLLVGDHELVRRKEGRSKWDD